MTENQYALLSELIDLALIELRLLAGDGATNVDKLNNTIGLRRSQLIRMIIDRGEITDLAVGDQS